MNLMFLFKTKLTLTIDFLNQIKTLGALKLFSKVLF
jgi:hypothetical protein